jgi:hypothetical protein
VQAAVVEDLFLLAVTRQATMVVLVEMAEVVAEPPTTQAHQVLAATALFIFTTKE